MSCSRGVVLRPTHHAEDGGAGEAEGRGRDRGEENVCLLARRDERREDLAQPQPQQQQQPHVSSGSVARDGGHVQSITC